PLSPRSRFGTMVGSSAAIRAAFEILERAAATDATVLLTGETGTGKEAAAESLHMASSRRDRPFLVVDCGSIPPTLLEAELLGSATPARRAELTSARFLGELAAHRWSGNVRELRNYLERCLVLGVALAPVPDDGGDAATAMTAVVDASCPLPRARDEATRRF